MLPSLAVTLIVAVAFVGANEAPRCDKNILWTGGSFEWPCAATKSMFKNSGRYISKNILATRAAIYKDDAILALPRLKPGVPVTLARVSLKDKSYQVNLFAFPCWTLQEEGTCSALQNVVDIYLDPQEILWVLDTGIVNSLEQPVRKCPPKVVALNAKTGKLVKTIDLSGLTSASSRLQYVVADYNPADGRAFIYVSDAATRAILVYDVISGRGYRVVLPQAVTLNCSRRDVLYLALMRRQDGSTCLIFTYLGSNRLFSIGTHHLRNGSAHGKIHDLGPKPKRMIILGTDNGSALFFRFEGEAEVHRWDSNTPFVPANFQSVYKSTDCYLPTHVIADYKRGRMRVLESNFPDYMMGTVGCGTNHALILM